MIFNIRIDNLKQKAKKGFTLVEAITATVILSFSVVVLAGIATRELNSTKNMGVYERAWDLADRQLTVISYVGVGKYVIQGPMEGVFEDNDTEFMWKAEIQEAEEDGFLYDVRLTVVWGMGKKSQSITVQTKMRSD